MKEIIEKHLDGSIEKWRDVSGYEDLYMVSSRGRVKRLKSVVRANKDGGKKTLPEKLVKLSVAKNGYHLVGLWKNNKVDFYHVHRLVLETFVGPCPCGMLCRHFPDRCKTNNNLDNLSWGTRSENELDKRAHGTDNSVAKVRLVCENCGREYFLVPWELRRHKTPRRFCSQICYHKMPRNESHKSSIGKGLRTAYAEGRR